MPLDLLATTVRHFFPRFNQRLRRIYDRRDKQKSTYSVPHLIWEELLMFLCGIGSRHAMVKETERPGFVRTLLDLCGSDEDAAAHPDTPYSFLAQLHPCHLIKFQAACARRLFRMRCLEKFRFGAEWLVAVDATWLRTYDYKHCNRCLHQTREDGTTRWMHAVLEAKLILGNGMVISLASVPIENVASRNFDKQDCELKAFGRLAEKLKQFFPKLPVCLLLDSLYACAPVMELCEKMNWSYIAVFTEGETPALWARAVEKAQKQPTHQITHGDGKVQNFRWAEMLQHQEHITHAVFCEETEPGGTGHTWAWITDHRPDRYWAPIIANKGGRLRWKIENEGFNEQKNGEFELKHDYGSKGHAWYNDYLVVQVAHMLVQLVQFGDLVNKASNRVYKTFTDAFGTIRGFFVRLRESVNRDRMAIPGLDRPGPSIQIRFDTS